MPIGRVTTRSAGTAILWTVSLSRQASAGCGAGSRAQDERRFGGDVRADGVAHLARSESGEVVDPGIEVVLEGRTQP